MSELEKHTFTVMNLSIHDAQASYVFINPKRKYGLYDWVTSERVTKAIYVANRVTLEILESLKEMK